ncbi:MAG: hypothetical protein ACTSPL_04295 [Candidatus Odinarchaeia archaeon]
MAEKTVEIKFKELKNIIIYFTLLWCLILSFFIAYIFYIAMLSGGSVVITVNSYGEMFIEAYIIIPAMLIIVIYGVYQIIKKMRSSKVI